MTQLIIADTFKDYEGTMLVVSHNLEFVDNLGIERMLLLPSGRIMYYDKNVVLHYVLLNEEVDKKDITIFSLIIIAFIWLLSITIFLFNFYQEQESNYWYMLRDVKD